MRGLASPALTNAGSLQVTIEPSGAVSNGAEWQVNGGAFQASHAILTNLAAGNYTVSFNTISNWTAPTNETVTISNGVTTTITNVYVATVNGSGGALTVTLQPIGAVAAGAAWILDGGPVEASGTTLSNLSAGTHTVSFVPVAGWETPGDQTVTITNGSNTTITDYYEAVINGQTGSLTVNLEPPGAVTAGAEWLVDGGASQTNGATVTLATGSHTVSFTTVSGWKTPVEDIIVLTNGATTTVTGIYTPTSVNGTLTLLTNGAGIIRHGAWQKLLVIGKRYTVTAVPGSKNLFSNWVSGTNFPLAVVSALPAYTFTMQSNLVLEANFGTNVFLNAQGSYRGLFGPPLGPRGQTDSGAIALNVSGSGTISGTLSMSGETMSLSGKFNAAGAATLVTQRGHGAYPMTTSLQLNATNQSISGYVSDGTFYAGVQANGDVFNHANKAAFAGQYNLIIPGTNNPIYGPMGVSYAAVTVDDSGNVKMAGSLADGTSISQSSIVSKDGYWPLYVNLYGGNGSLWGWICFTNQTVLSAPTLSWLSITNTARQAVYPSGFTDQKATLTGSIYVPGKTAIQSGTVTLQGGNLPSTITVSNLSQNTDGLVLKINDKTGIISGSFVNPNDSKKTIAIHGIALQTNGVGYFLGTNQSGIFTIGLP